MTEQDDAIRKAAILIDSLDGPAADALLDQMTHEEGVQVRNAMLQLNDVDAGERNRIIDEFIDGGFPAQVAGTADVEMVDSLADKIASTKHPSADAGEHRPRFGFLNDASADWLARFLASEHPQTVSIVLAHLPPRRAADVLSRLEPKFQAEVLGRLARLDETDTSVVCEVGRELERLIQRTMHVTEERPMGLAAVEAIIDASDGGCREALLAHLEACDRRIAQQLGYTHRAHGRDAAFVHKIVSPNEEGGREHPPVTDRTRPSDSASALDFNDLIELGDVALTKVFRAADPGTTLLALTGASQQMLDRILRRLPLREARRFRRQMEQLGPTRLSDLEQAQQQLAELAGRMADQGEILVPKYRRFTAAA
jgi:flagellar motor switch protein FliG